VLRISPPAVSKASGRPEFDLALQLFIPTPKGLAAKDEARALYAEVERAFAFWLL
jgi:DNA-binding transcriptional LysR family regulator